MTTRPLVILGTGRIARALLGQLLERDAYLRDRYGLELPVAAIGNSRYLVRGDPHVAPDHLAAIAARGLEAGEGVPADLLTDSGRQVVDFANAQGEGGDGGEKVIVVDLTASDDTTGTLVAALDAGHDVALANKKPLCVAQDVYTRLVENPHGHIAYEATVGAGLPIVATLRALFAAGDTLTEATACLSGTLGYVCTLLEEGRPLSEIVPEARARGYTEPDPREDLGGDDVRRKALILARTMGQCLEMADIAPAPLIPLEDGPLDAWLVGLARHDRTLASRAHVAREQDLVLRYIARISPGGCEVGLREVPRVSAVGRLHDTDNLLTAYTRFYDERPLIISGPGAGPNVTAAGVFADLLRLSGAG